MNGLTVPNQKSRNMITMRNRDQIAVALDTIKQNVSALDAGKALGLDIKRNRCKCPIHGGHDYNCVLFRDERGFYCHVCHEKGDVIALIQQVEFGSRQGTFIAAIKWANEAFNLGLDIDTPIDRKTLRKAKIRLNQRRYEQEFRERQEQLDFDMYLTVSDLLRKLEDIRDANRPKRYSEEWNDKFCYAVRLIPSVKRMVDDCYMRCTVVRRGRKF